MKEYIYSWIVLFAVVQDCYALPIWQRQDDPSHNEITASDTNEIRLLEDYLSKYTNYMKQEIEAAKASSGHAAAADGATPDVPVAQSPIFIESLINFQRLAGITPTGNVTKETIENVAQDRCGVPDPVEDPDAPGQYKINTIWKDNHNHSTGLYHITYSVTKEGFPTKANFTEFEKALASAMCSWELTSNIRFENVGPAEATADVSVKFGKGDHGDGYPFDGKGKTLAHAFYPDDGRLHFDAEEDWYLAKDGAVNYLKRDFYTVALHELGHTIGLYHSKAEKSVMNANYRYFGTFNTFDLPEDDWKGVAHMYGKRKSDDPASDEKSACRELTDKFGIKVTPKRAVVETKEARSEEYRKVEAICEDDDDYKGHCDRWKREEFCTRTNFVDVMHRRCKKTCGFCPDIIKKVKTSPQKVSSLVTSICDIPEFDSVSTVYDGADGFFSYIFKDDYHFKNKVTFTKDDNSQISLLNATETLNDSHKWVFDPKSYTPGVFKFRTVDFLAMSEKVDALITVGNLYLAFDGERVHSYSKSTPIVLYEETFELGDLFPGYPHDKVDAAYVEFDSQQQSPTYTLFHGDKIWQFQEAFETNEDNRVESRVRPFMPITDRLDVEIFNWHGVHACDLDSVFSYQGIPYFLKGNTFWPATDAEPQIPRDITYSFFRCWQEEPLVLEIPSACDVSSPSNGAASFNLNRMFAFNVSVLSFYLKTLFSSLL